MTAPATREGGMTLIELIVAAAIMAILAAAALPLYEVTVRRGREVELRNALRTTRRAIDEFHISYVASGGQTSQGPTVLMGGARTPAQNQNSGGPTASSPASTSTTGGNPAPGPVALGTVGSVVKSVQLIDVSQFDPIDSKGYPPDLKTLAEGVQVSGGTTDDLVKFLRRVPVDPFAAPESIDPGDPNYGWGVRSYQDELDSVVWGHQNAYDIYSRSTGTALDGSKYRDW